MNSKIKQALVILLNEEVRIASWGLSNISITETSIMFDVDGFIYSGRIIIKSCKKTSYQITFNDGSTENIEVTNSSEGLVVLNKARVLTTAFITADKLGLLSEEDVNEIKLSVM